MPDHKTEEIGHFIERFAATLADAGMPRLASRVFVTLLASDTGRMTAAELAERLRASSGGISGAVRYLIQVNMARREREPGTRRDVYVVDTLWYEATLAAKSPILTRGEADLREGLAALVGSPAADRLSDTLEMLEFINEEAQATQRRWEERKAQRDQKTGQS